MCMAFYTSSMGINTTRHLQTSGRLVQEFDGCTVAQMHTRNHLTNSTMQTSSENIHFLKKIVSSNSQCMLILKILTDDDKT